MNKRYVLLTVLLAIGQPYRVAAAAEQETIGTVLDGMWNLETLEKKALQPIVANHISKPINRENVEKLNAVVDAEIEAIEKNIKATRQKLRPMNLSNQKYTYLYGELEVLLARVSTYEKNSTGRKQHLQKGSSSLSTLVEQILTDLNSLTGVKKEVDAILSPVQPSTSGPQAEQSETPGRKPATSTLEAQKEALLKIMRPLASDLDTFITSLNATQEQANLLRNQANGDLDDTIKQIQEMLTWTKLASGTIELNISTLENAVTKTVENAIQFVEGSNYQTIAQQLERDRENLAQIEAMLAQTQQAQQAEQERQKAERETLDKLLTKKNKQLQALLSLGLKLQQDLRNAQELISDPNDTQELHHADISDAQIAQLLDSLKNNQANMDKMAELHDELNDAKSITDIQAKLLDNRKVARRDAPQAAHTNWLAVLQELNTQIDGRLQHFDGIKNKLMNYRRQQEEERAKERERTLQEQAQQSEAARQRQGQPATTELENRQVQLLKTMRSLARELDAFTASLNAAQTKSNDLRNQGTRGIDNTVQQIQPMFAWAKQASGTIELNISSLVNATPERLAIVIGFVEGSDHQAIAQQLEGNRQQLTQIQNILEQAQQEQAKEEIEPTEQERAKAAQGITAANINELWRKISQHNYQITPQEAAFLIEQAQKNIVKGMSSQEAFLIRRSYQLIRANQQATGHLPAELNEQWRAIGRTGTKKSAQGEQK